MANMTGARRAALNERGDDLYETPAEAVHALMAREELPRCIWEPACGPGAIVRLLRAAGHLVYATDLRDYGCPDSLSRVDFLLEQLAPVHVEAIVTNPPYRLANAFVYRALELVPRVCMLLPLRFMEGGEKDWRRDRIIDGGQLARVLVFRERLPMMHRHGWSGKLASSTTTFAWFVWDRAHKGGTVMERISWRRVMADHAAGKVKAA